MKVSDILRNKGTDVLTISHKQTLRDALNLMTNNKVGSLVVIDSGSSPIGIVTERDVLRVVDKKSSSWHSEIVNDVMTENIIISLPDDDIEHVMSLMTKNRFRHMPIVEKGKLAGLISIGDIVKSQMKNIKAENRYLSDYITGKYPA